MLLFPVGNFHILRACDLAKPRRIPVLRRQDLLLLGGPVFCGFQEVGPSMQEADSVWSILEPICCPFLGINGFQVQAVHRTRVPGSNKQVIGSHKAVCCHRLRREAGHARAALPKYSWLHLSERRRWCPGRHGVTRKAMCTLPKTNLEPAQGPLDQFLVFFQRHFCAGSMLQILYLLSRGYPVRIC